MIFLLINILNKTFQLRQTDGKRKVLVLPSKLLYSLTGLRAGAINSHHIKNC